MALWLANLAAYSVQLVALVGTGLLVVAVLRLSVPTATLRFWQLLFAASVLWPLWQLWASAAAVTAGTPLLLDDAGSSDVFWAAAARDLQSGVTGLSHTVLWTGGIALGLGVAVRLSWLGIGLVKLRSIRAGSERADVLAPIAGPLQQELGITADIRFSDAVGSPATIGARRPIVLLPPCVRALPASMQRAVLCHELLHVRRGDWAWALVEEVWCAVLWFHPAARMLTSRLAFARETLVDEATVAHTGDRRAYALALLEFSTTPTRLAGATALIGRRHLARRIALLAEEVPMRHSATMLRLALAVAAVAVATLTASATLPLRASAQEPERVYRPGPEQGVTLPRIVREVKPQYTAAAMQAKIQGTVWMTAVVLTDGTVSEVKVVKSLDTEHGLDEQAVNAMRQWKFEPGTKDGQPVPVEITVEMTFTLKQ